MDPCENYDDLLDRITKQHYYCHPLYTDLHTKSQSIVDLYISWKKTLSKETGAEIGRQIKKWVEIFESVPYKKSKVFIETSDCCAICLDTPKPGSSVRKCVNNHVYCESCMIELIAAKKEEKYMEMPSCPTCRGKINFDYSKNYCASTKNVIGELSNTNRSTCSITS